MKVANLCRSCGQDFAYVGGFDDHRVGEHDYTLSEGLRMDPPREDGRRCLSESEMVARGWGRDKHGRWVTGAAATDEDAEHLLSRVAL